MIFRWLGLQDISNLMIRSGEREYKNQGSLNPGANTSNMLCALCSMQHSTNLRQTEKTLEPRLHKWAAVQPFDWCRRSVPGS